MKLNSLTILGKYFKTGDFFLKNHPIDFVFHLNAVHLSYFPNVKSNVHYYQRMSNIKEILYTHENRNTTSCSSRVTKGEKRRKEKREERRMRRGKEDEERKGG